MQAQIKPKQDANGKYVNEVQVLRDGKWVVFGTETTIRKANALCAIVQKLADNTPLPQQV